MWNPSLIDVIGSLEGTEGFHLNVAPECYTDDLAAFVVTPDNPQRVFAGAATVFLRFADEDEARANLSSWWVDAP